MNNIKPILSSGPMVRALSDGRKTQTRRVLKPQPPDGHRFVGIYGPGLTAVFEPLSHTVRLPYMPGQLLWVRETWAIDDAVRSRGRYGRPDVYYLADRRPDVPSPDGLLTSAQLINMHLDSLRKRPAIHMPRWASRLT